MTEAEWLTAATPEPMSQFLGARVSRRKWQLFGCACCRRHWHWIEGTPAAKAIEVAERFADGRATLKKLWAARTAAENAASDFYAEFQRAWGIEPYIAHVHTSACVDAASPVPDTRLPNPILAVRAANYVAHAYAHETTDATEKGSNLFQAHAAAESAMHAGVLRDVIGNPFRPVALAPAWRTADVQLLAEGIYNESAFERMPILADALQDAGCDSAPLLDHLRDPGLLPWERTEAPGPAPVSHARGCWALDLVLGFA